MAGSPESSDPRLDVLSPQFDPLQALNADSVKLPFPQIGALENLKQYQALTSGKAPRRGGRRIAAETRQEETSAVGGKEPENNDVKIICNAHTLDKCEADN